MAFKDKVTLLGIKPSQGQMKDDEGKLITWDQIELHVLASLSQAAGAIGQTVQIHKWRFDGAASSAAVGKLAKLIGSEISMTMEMVADGKGGAPKLTVMGVDLPA